MIIDCQIETSVPKGRLVLFIPDDEVVEILSAYAPQEDTDVPRS